MDPIPPRALAQTCSPGARMRGLLNGTAARGIAHTIRHFGDTIHPIHDAPVDEVCAGLIDQTPDALPVLQAMAEPQRLVAAMGFSGHGFCLGPITGRIMAALVQGKDIDLPFESFRIERFDGWNGVAELIALHG